MGRQGVKVSRVRSATRPNLDGKNMYVNKHDIKPTTTHNSDPSKQYLRHGESIPNIMIQTATPEMPNQRNSAPTKNTANNNNNSTAINSLSARRNSSLRGEYSPNRRRIMASTSTTQLN